MSFIKRNDKLLISMIFFDRKKKLKLDTKFIKDIQLLLTMSSGK